MFYDIINIKVYFIMNSFRIAKERISIPSQR